MPTPSKAGVIAVGNAFEVPVPMVATGEFGMPNAFRNSLTEVGDVKKIRSERGGCLAVSQGMCSIRAMSVSIQLFFLAVSAMNDSGSSFRLIKSFKSVYLSLLIAISVTSLAFSLRSRWY